jgi:hypothetical protein
MPQSYDFKRIDLEKIYLDRENPRTGPMSDQAQAIERLLEDEKVENLAADIAEVGLNPVDLIAVVPDKTADPDGALGIYTVVEGNRRVCAVMLLNDPDRAPGAKKDRFRKLAAETQWTPLKSIQCVVVESRDSAAMWMRRLHLGEQDGVGRKTWSPDQQARFDLDSKNRMALELLDYAERIGAIDRAQRQRRITTVQRYLDVDGFRKALGVELDRSAGLLRFREAAEFDALIRQFVRDLLSGAVHSRAGREHILAYAEELLKSLAEPKPLGEKGAPLKTPAETPQPKPPAPKPPPPPPPRPNLDIIKHNPELHEALTALGNDKLLSLYASLVSLDLNKHAPLGTIGALVLVEALARQDGLKDTTSIADYFNISRIERIGFTTRETKNAISVALKGLALRGNVTKHHDKAASFHGPQLRNDMEVLSPLLTEVAHALAAPST